MRKLLFPLLLAFLLCTCDRAPDTLFALRSNTGVTSANMLLEREDFNIIEYLYYYNGGGVAATDINGDGLPDLYFTNNQGPNKYYINEGDFRFRDGTELGAVAGAGDWSTGVSVVDVDGNGLMDIYVCNVSGYKGLEGRNELFLQQDDGTFIEAAADYGLDFAGFNTQAYWFDYDRDGDLDMYLLRHSVHNDATYGTAAGRNVPDSLAGDMLLRNDQKLDGTLFGALLKEHKFTNVTQPANLYSSKIGYGLSATVADFNRDGWPDLYVCNDFSENDYYYLNQQDGTFQESVRERTGHTSNFSMGSDAGDFDADGWPDLFTLDMRPMDETILKATMSADQPNVYNLKRSLGYYDQLPHNALQWNRGDGHFSEVAEMAGVAASDWSWSCLVEDFDLDGKQDIFIANGIERRPNGLDFLKFISSGLANQAANLEVLANMPSGHVPNVAFRQKGDWNFEEVGKAWGLDLNGSSTGAAVADFDQDGDLDLVLNNLNAPASLYENTARSPGEKGANGSLSDPEEQNSFTNRMWIAPQRGMMSQSEGGYDWQPNVATSTTPWYKVLGSGITREGREGSYFDTEPLAYAAPRELSYPVVRLPDGIALRQAGEPEFQTYRWTGEQLELAAAYAMPALRNTFPELQAPDKPLEANFPAEEFTLMAEPWAAPRIWTGGDDYYPIGLPEGLWQSVSKLQGSGGGGTTVLLGNWGRNSVLGTPTAEAPVNFYLEDVDENGKEDPLLTYIRQDKEMTVADKDELSSQLPGMRRNNLSYTDFAGRSFTENFPTVKMTPLRSTTFDHFLLTRNNGGTWESENLPPAAQLTPINCALEIPEGILLGGNKLEVLPRIGRQDAAALQLLRPDGSIEFIDLGGNRNRLEIRQLVSLGDRHVLLVVAEGEHLILELDSRDLG